MYVHVIIHRNLSCCFILFYMVGISRFRLFGYFSKINGTLKITVQILNYDAEHSNHKLNLPLPKL